MSDKPKGYGPLDLAVSSVIADLLADAGRGLRAVAADAGMSHNRLGKIKRAATPPPVVGEIDRIAVALGTTAAAVFLEADRRLRGDGGATVTPIKPPAPMSDPAASVDPIAALDREINEEFEGR